MSGACWVCGGGALTGGERVVLCDDCRGPYRSEKRRLERRVGAVREQLVEALATVEAHWPSDHTRGADLAASLRSALMATHGHRPTQSATWRAAAKRKGRSASRSAERQPEERQDGHQGRSVPQGGVLGGRWVP